MAAAPATAPATIAAIFMGFFPKREATYTAATPKTTAAPKTTVG